MRSEEAKKANDYLTKIYEEQLDLIDRLVAFRHAYPVGYRLDVGIAATVDLMSKAHAWLAAYIQAYKDAAEGLRGDVHSDMIDAAKANGGDIASSSKQILSDMSRVASLSSEMYHAAREYDIIRDEEIMKHAGLLIAEWIEGK